MIENGGTAEMVSVIRSETVGVEAVDDGG